MQTADVTWQTLKGIGEMFTGARSAKELGGPIRIAEVSGEAASLAVGNALGGTFTLLRKPVSGIDLADRVATLLGEPAPRAEAGD